MPHISYFISHTAPLTTFQKIMLGFGVVFIILGLKKCYSGKNDWVYVGAYHIQVPMRYGIHGIDVSWHNGKINWKQIEASRVEDCPIRFCFIKATEAVSIKDRQFTTNWQGAKQIGLLRGAYHFYNPGLDPTRQADHFVQNVALQANDLPPVLDFEIESKVLPAKKVKQNIKIWLDLVENHYGRKPIIYTNRHIFKKYIQDNLDDYPIWIADYGNKDIDDLPAKHLAFWQYSQTGKIRGISEKVDFNVFLGSERELQELKIEN